MLKGMQEPYRKGASESILASNLAGDIARCFLKHASGVKHSWLSVFYSMV